MQLYKEGSAAGSGPTHQVLCKTTSHDVDLPSQQTFSVYKLKGIGQSRTPVASCTIKHELGRICIMSLIAEHCTCIMESL